MKAVKIILSSMCVSFLLISVSFSSKSRTSLINEISPPSKPQQGIRRIFFYNPSGDEKQLLALRQKLVKHEARNVNVFLPSYLVCELPSIVQATDLISSSKIIPVEESRLDLEIALGRIPGLDRVKRCYDLAKVIAGKGEGEQLKLGAFSAEGAFRDSVLIVPPELIHKVPDGMPETSPGLDTRNPQQNSEFLLGHTLVQLILPESVGNGENWTESQLSEAIMGAYAAMLSFQERYDYVSINFTFKIARKAVTYFEPIEHNEGTDYLWIRDVMAHMGYTDAREGAIGVVHHYNNDGRNFYRADWVFTAFIANSQHAPNHRFKSARYTAYAYLGGPYFVMPYPAGENPYYIDRVLLFSQVFQHEASHIFWALDEYADAVGNCTDHSGYLDYFNRNKILEVDLFGNPIGCRRELDLCIMARAKEDLGRPVCSFTTGQLGAIDANNNGIPDAFESVPEIRFENAPVETVTTSDITVRCKAVSIPVPNNNPRQNAETRIDYAAPLKDAFLTVDGIGNLVLLPQDGRWDEVEEDLVINLHSIPPGETSIGIKVRNKVGIASPVFIKKIYNVGLNFSLFDVNIKNQEIFIRWRIIGETFGANFDLYRVSGSSGPSDTLTLAQDLQPDSCDTCDGYLHFSYTDSAIEPGMAYRYFVRGSFWLGEGSQSRFFNSDSEIFTATARLPLNQGDILTHAVPNPFRTSTSFSIYVIKTERETGPSSADGSPHTDGQSNLPSLKEEVQTPVDVSIYDVTGRLVKKIYKGTLRSTTITRQWDGTNQRNQKVPSGVYFLRARSGPYTQVRKLVLIR